MTLEEELDKLEEIENFYNQLIEIQTHFKQTYNRGVPQRDLAEVGTAHTTGTNIPFMPDDEIFSNTKVLSYVVPYAYPIKLPTKSLPTIFTSSKDKVLPFSENWRNFCCSYGIMTK